MTNKSIDWKALAEAWRLEIPNADLERIAPRLDAVNEVFRPLAEDLRPDQEPATVFQADPEQP